MLNDNWVVGEGADGFAGDEFGHDRNRLRERTQPPPFVVDRVRSTCARLLGAVEHEAWTGTSWRVKRTVFVHVVQIAEGWPPAYANAFDTPGPATVVTFQADPDEYHALTQGPFHAPPWRPGIIGTIIGPNTDWVELAELITESHCVCR